MTYFHRCTSTIIGAKAFHGPVRDGKAWDHLAMVVKRKLGCTPALCAGMPIGVEAQRVCVCWIDLGCAFYCTVLHVLRY